MLMNQPSQGYTAHGCKQRANTAALHPAKSLILALGVSQLSTFSPKKTIKNIVYYQQRLEALTEDSSLMPPQLAIYAKVEAETTASDDSVLTTKRSIKLKV